MSKSTIYHKQCAQEGIFTLKGISLIRLLHNIIREYGVYHDGSMSVNAKEISFPDMRLLLSYVLESSDYEWACGDDTRTEVIYMDNLKYIQSLLDDECYTVYCENMEEQGMTRCTHPNNDEVYWIRR